MQTPSNGANINPSYKFVVRHVGSTNSMKLKKKEVRFEIIPPNDTKSVINVI